MLATILINRINPATIIIIYTALVVIVTVIIDRGIVWFRYKRFEEAQIGREREKYFLSENKKLCEEIGKLRRNELGYKKVVLNGHGQESKNLERRDFISD